MPDLVKRCPACNEENPVSEVICRVCMTNLASVSPTPRGEAGDVSVSEALLPEKAEKKADAAPAVLTLSRLSDGRFVPVSVGSVLGRSGDAGAFFEDFRTVSRRHAKVDFRDESWWIEDLNSTNGTWVNGSRLDPGRSHPLKKGDTVALSLACEMKVVS
ncbi:MAG: FHA domain-containing protein [Synergistaceae bacterium]|nr:FHA domain-containing protein [Synergistaceae bacterium]